MLIYEKTFKPTGEMITKVRDEFMEACRRSFPEKMLAKNRLALTFESRLVALREIYGENNDVTVRSRKRGGKLILDISYKGENEDVLLNTEAPYDWIKEKDELDICRSILEHFSAQSRHFKYSPNSGQCKITLVYRSREANLMLNILAALVLAVATGILLRLAPADLTSSVNEIFLTPFFNKITTVIAKIAAALIFLSVINGIAGTGNADVLRNTGGRFLGNMFISYAVAVGALSLAAFFFYGLDVSGSSSSSSAVNQILALVLDMIPDDLLQAFIDGNDLSLIVVAVFIGFVLMLLGEKVKAVNDLISMLVDVVNKMMAIVCKFLPFLVFLGIVKMFITDLGDISRLYKVFVIFVICEMILLLFTLIRTKSVVKQPIGKLFKKQLPTTMINLTTSSQVAALPENFKCCIEKFGIRQSFVNYTLPLGIVIFMPSGAIFVGLISWGMADVAGMPIDLACLIKIAVTAVVVAIAAPPIPGSAFAVMPIMFSVCGISFDYYPLAIVLGTVIGYFLPVLNGYILQLNLLISAKQLGIIDEEKLKAGG